MLTENDFIFITNSLKTKLIEYADDNTYNIFGKRRIIIDCRKRWYICWFDFLNKLKDIEEKYFVMVDDDIFFEEKEPLIELINHMDKNNYSLSGIPDGGSRWRRWNPIAVNPFFMVGNVKDVVECWDNNMNHKYNKEWEKYLDKDKIVDTKRCHFVDFKSTPWQGEPFYTFFWSLLKKDKKFYYLYPEHINDYDSTSPRMTKHSSNIAHHLWHSRNWNSTHKHRYKKFFKEKLNIDLI